MSGNGNGGSNIGKAAIAVLLGVLITGAAAWVTFGASDIPKLEHSVRAQHELIKDHEVRLRAIEKSSTVTASELGSIRRELERIRKAVER